MSHILCYIQPSGAPNTTQPNTTPQITNYLGAALLQQTPPLLDAQQPRTVPSGCLVRNFNGSTISQQCVCSLQHQQPSYPSCNRPFLPRHRPHPGTPASALCTLVSTPPMLPAPARLPSLLSCSVLSSAYVRWCRCSATVHPHPAVALLLGFPLERMPPVPCWAYGFSAPVPQRLAAPWSATAPHRFPPPTGALVARIWSAAPVPCLLCS